MTRCLFVFGLLIVGLFGTLAQADEVVQFSSAEQELRYQTLTEELRCPKCQNQNLEDSNAGIAVDLRHQIFLMINDGKTDEQIIDYMVARYGEFVLYRPVHDQSTVILWYGPFFLVVIGGLIFLVIALKNAKRAKRKESNS